MWHNRTPPTLRQPLKLRHLRRITSQRPQKLFQTLPIDSRSNSKRLLIAPIHKSLSQTDPSPLWWLLEKSVLWHSSYGHPRSPRSLLSLPSPGSQLWTSPHYTKSLGQLHQTESHRPTPSPIKISPLDQSPWNLLHDPIILLLHPKMFQWTITITLLIHRIKRRIHDRLVGRSPQPKPPAKYQRPINRISKNLANQKTKIKSSKISFLSRKVWQQVLENISRIKRKRLCRKIQWTVSIMMIDKDLI